MIFRKQMMDKKLGKMRQWLEGDKKLSFGWEFCFDLDMHCIHAWNDE